MATVKSTLDSLTDEQRRKLMHAFEIGLPQHVELPGKRFIGVNLKGRVRNFTIEQEAGLWTIGVIK